MVFNAPIKTFKSKLGRQDGKRKAQAKKKARLAAGLSV
jgi:hypothetical protein